MKKLIYPFVEIEIPDDAPDSQDWEEVWAYLEQHPEVGEQVEREYLAAYSRWEAEGGLERWLAECHERNHVHAPKDQRVGYYFRYDHHPEVGDPATHPLHHLHAAGWQPDDEQLYEGVRHPVNEISFGEVLRLIRLRFPFADS